MRSRLVLILLFACHNKPQVDAAPSSLPVTTAPTTVRVLLLQSDDELPRADAPDAVDMLDVQALCEKLGLVAELTTFSDRALLLRALADGRGDLVAAPLVAEPSAGVAWSVPVRQTEVVVAVKKGAATPDRVTLPAAHPFTALLANFKARHFAVDTLDKPVDAQTLLARVADGEIAATLVSRDDLQAYSAYRRDVDAAVTLGTLPIVWAVRPEARELLQSVNAYWSQNALTSHRQIFLGGDLDEIRRRKVLRVALQNTPASYFLYRGQQMGFQYEWAAFMAKTLGVRLQVVVPDKPEDMSALLLAGRVDLVATPVTDSDDAQEAGIDRSAPFISADQVLVQPANETPLTQVDDLAGKTVHVRRSSAYYKVLEQIRRSGVPVTLVAADEKLQTEDLIDRVGKKQIPYTVANSLLFGIERTNRDDVQAPLRIAVGQPLSFAMRKNSPALLAWVNQFIKKEFRGSIYNQLYAKYFTDQKRIRERALTPAGSLSPYDDDARRSAVNYGIDWRLVVAQMYQESRFDPKAKSWVGASGLLQVMPETAAAMGLGSLEEPAVGIEAGVKYLREMTDRFDPAIDFRQRLRFALAAYNAGFNHVSDARELAREQGLDGDRWFGNVERAILMLEKKEYYAHARHGFCRGRETLKYVSEIQTRYEAYVEAAK